MSTTRTLPRLQWPAPPKPQDSLRLLVESGASPTQMLWGLVWCHTLPALFKSLATFACAVMAARVAGLALG
jgi:hypothetical protein